MSWPYGANWDALQLSVGWVVRNCVSDFHTNISHCLFSPALVGNLWNVLDRDISSFAETILRQLLSDCDNVPLTSVISTARSSCNYKYLIGAAPVIYGLPLIFDTKLH